MKKIILCEGKTDAILLSYFLIKSFGWEYIIKPYDRLPELPVDENKEVFHWYQHSDKPNQELAIWGVGGISKIPSKLNEVVNRTSREGSSSANRFRRIVLFFDHDDRTTEACLNLAKKWIRECNRIITHTEIELDKWLSAKLELNKTPKEEYEIQILPIVLPMNEKGDLEVFLADSLRERSEDDKLLVDEAHCFISRIPDKPYLTKRRYRSKACLGSILSVISPDWEFSDRKIRLTQIEWEKIESLVAIYGKLGEL
jgi:hypothetical protein